MEAEPLADRSSVALPQWIGYLNEAGLYGFPPVADRRVWYRIRRRRMNFAATVHPPAYVVRRATDRHWELALVDCSSGVAGKVVDINVPPEIGIRHTNRLSQQPQAGPVPPRRFRSKVEDWPNFPV